MVSGFNPLTSLSGIGPKVEKLYRRLLGYVRPYKAVFGAAILGMLLVASTDVMMLRIIQPLLNNISAIDAEHTFYLPKC